MTFKIIMYKFNIMKILTLFTLICTFAFALKTEITLKAKAPGDRDLGCITLLELASEKSKNAEETVKYEKLKKLKKSIQSKYKDDYFSEKDTQLKLTEHKLKIKEKGQRYINKGLQKCGLK